MLPTDTAVKWSDNFHFDLHQTCRWQIGQLQLYIKRGAQEWHVFHRYLSEGDHSLDLKPFLENAELPETVDEFKAKRHVFGQTGSELVISPCLPDRSLVVRPLVPCVIHPGESTTLYVSSPIWLKIEANRKPRLFMEELPSRRLSDTWFGANTRFGELCYATKTRALTSTEGIEFFPFRAVSPVHILNKSEKSLTFDRLSLPLPLLDLFQDRQGYFWTQGLTLLASQDMSMAELKFSVGAPRQAGEASLVSHARVNREKGLLVRAFHILFNN